MGLATSEKWRNLSPDDRQLIPEAGRAGIEAMPVVWTDPAADWKSFDLVVIRSCWDYHLRIDDFLTWIDRLETRVANPAGVVRWNPHKGYLLELEAKGIRIPPTQLVAKAT